MGPLRCFQPLMHIIKSSRERSTASLQAAGGSESREWQCLARDSSRGLVGHRQHQDVRGVAGAGHDDGGHQPCGRPTGPCQQARGKPSCCQPPQPHPTPIDGYYHPETCCALPLSKSLWTTILAKHSCIREAFASKIEACHREPHLHSSVGRPAFRCLNALSFVVPMSEAQGMTRRLYPWRSWAGPGSMWWSIAQASSGTCS